MSKRFTDTDKWKRAWFYELDAKCKLIWLYLLDQCDHVGIWPANFRLLSEQTGVKVTRESFDEWFLGKVIPFDEDKYFIPSFFKFQYGMAKEGFKAKASALKTIQDLGLEKYLLATSEEIKEILRETTRTTPNCSEHLGNTTEHLGNCSEQSMDCPSIGIGIGIGKSISNNKKEDEEKNEKPTLKDLETIYQSYPLKKGKSEGLSRLTKEIKTWDQYSDLGRAIDAYKADLARNKTEAKFIKHFSTFVSSWRDWLEPVESQDFSKPKFEQVEIDQETRDLWEGKWE